MVCLTIAIIVLCIKINLRGPKPVEEVASVSADEMVASNGMLGDSNSVSEDGAEDVAFEAHFDIVGIPNTTSSVNVRSGPGTDYERIGSAYSTSEYVVLEILDSGWTKIEYDNQTGYISSEFLEYKRRQDLGDGTYSYDEITDDISHYKAE